MADLNYFNVVKTGNVFNIEFSITDDNGAEIITKPEPITGGEAAIKWAEGQRDEAIEKVEKLNSIISARATKAAYYQAKADAIQSELDKYQ